MTNQPHADSREMARWVVNGALAGASVASMITLARWIKLNRELKKYDTVKDVGTKDTLVVNVPPERLGKQASNTIPELVSGGLVGGIGSYMALTWLANKIENMRMKKIEEQARQDVLNELLRKESSEKRAFIDKLLPLPVELLRSKHLWMLLAALGVAYGTKKKMDVKARQSDDIKPIVPDKIVFRPAEAEEEE